MKEFIQFIGDLEFFDASGVAAPAAIVLSNTTIGEAAEVGDLIGALSVQNGSGSYTFTLTDDGDGQAAIDGNRLEVNTSLTVPSFDVTVEADNGVDTPLTETFTIEIETAAGSQPGTITDLEAGFVDPANPDPGDPLLSEPTLITDPLILRWTEVSDEADAEAQFGIDGGDWFDEIVPLDLLEDAVATLDDSTLHKVRVRAISDTGRRGPWSDPGTFQTYTPSFGAAERDAKTSTYLGVGTSHVGFDLSALALDFVAGNLLVAIAHGQNGNDSFSLPAVPAGWNEIGGAFTDTGTRSAVRAIWKIADGTETTVQLIASVATNTIRVNFRVFSFDVKGTVEVGGTPTAFAAATNPPSQTIDAGPETEALLAVSSAHGTTSDPDQSFTDTVPAAITPTYNDLNSQTTTVSLRDRCKTKIYAANEAHTNIITDSGDLGQNSHISFFLTAGLPG